jgi:dienelactone hydrolase
MTHRFCRSILLVAALALTVAAANIAYAQPATSEDAKAIDAALNELRGGIDKLRKDPQAENFLADVEVYAKASEWIVRHHEFFKPDYTPYTLAALKTGMARAAELAGGSAKWEQAPGRRILAYRSAVDESVQPYAISLPAAFGKEPERRWPLHLVLHGRGATLNEVSFIREHDDKAATDDDSIQLDVFGRTNNGYRFAGETDVFEALADVKRRYRIDDRRIVLRGFSMGGAGSWHLGLHHPSRWCSVGPGAGFVDFYKYQKVETPLPFYQDLALSIYNPVDYTLNASNVPICTYGGEKDEQLVASTEMVERAGRLGLAIKLLIGPGIGHDFHPESKKEFMAFHLERQQAGRPQFPLPREIKFTTRTLKYNTCDWLTIEELITPYRETIVEAKMDEQSDVLHVKTKNVAVLQLARDVAATIEIDGDKLPLASAAEGLLPGVFFENSGDRWSILSYTTSLGFTKNPDHRKRHNLQGPIDDAFMLPFVCVRGTGTPWNGAQAAWADWTLDRFVAEFDKYMRGTVPVVDDSELTNEMMHEKNVILFGDPGSNSALAKIVDHLPVRWTKSAIEVNGQKYDPATHGVSLIYPNPLAPRKYVVLNSGHTFHATDFAKSNAWLFPRLGDIAVQKFEKEDGAYKETIVWADFFNSSWKLPSGLAPNTAPTE